MDSSFTEKESLALIGQMISTAKNNLQKGTGTVFLLWGYLVALISLVTFLLLLILPEPARYNAFYLWFLMAAGFPFHYLLVRRLENGPQVRTYIEQLMAWVWIAFTITILVAVAGLLAATAYRSANPGAPGAEGWFHWLFMTPFMLCLYGFALFVSGKAYRFRPLVSGGMFCMAAALVSLGFIYYSRITELNQIILCLSAIAGFIIPGHLLNGKQAKDVQGA